MKKVVASPIKKLGVVYSDGTDTYQFTYDDKKRVTKIENYWNDALDKTITYDYSVAGKLAIVTGTTTTNYEINAKGMVTKEDWGNGEYASYEYDNDGYLIKVSEFWDNISHKKMEAVVTNGNIMKHTSYNDDGVVTKIKEFTYTPGDNVNEIHQASMIDNNTKPMGNLFGKPSKKILASLQYWDPRVTPLVQKTTTINYTFDSKNRPTEIVRVLFDGSKETYTYGYFD